MHDKPSAACSSSTWPCLRPELKSPNVRGLLGLQFSERRSVFCKPSIIPVRRVVQASTGPRTKSPACAAGLVVFEERMKALVGSGPGIWGYKRVRTSRPVPPDEKQVSQVFV